MFWGERIPVADPRIDYLLFMVTLFGAIPMDAVSLSCLLMQPAIRAADCRGVPKSFSVPVSPGLAHCNIRPQILQPRHRPVAIEGSD